MKLTDDQVTKITALQTTAKKDSEAARAAMTPDADPMARQEAAQKLQAANKKSEDDITAVLTDDQKTKLPAFMKETQALVGAGLPAPALGDLKLTDDQKKQIVALTDKMQSDLQGLKGQERGAKQRELRKDVTEKTMALLTTEQKATLAKNKPARAPRPMADPGAKGNE